MVQLAPVEEINPSFHYCLMTVDEIHDWGVRGYVTTPGQSGSEAAYYRAAKGSYEYVGKVRWMQI